MMPASPAYCADATPMGWLRRAETWMDAKGRGAWIAALVLSFILFWPLGLAIAIYMTTTNRWSRLMTCRSRTRHADLHRAAAALRPSGNTAFDAYKADMMQRLEDEQKNFEAFLDRLRAAKDKAEFDAFMADRARAAAAPLAQDPDGDMTK